MHFLLFFCFVYKIKERILTRILHEYIKVFVKWLCQWKVNSRKDFFLFLLPKINNKTVCAHTYTRAHARSRSHIHRWHFERFWEREREMDRETFTFCSHNLQRQRTPASSRRFSGNFRILSFFCVFFKSFPYNNTDWLTTKHTHTAMKNVTMYDDSCTA